MPRRSRLSIPHELHENKAQQIYEQRIAEGRNGSSEGDWERARNELNDCDVIFWTIKKTVTKIVQLGRIACRRLRYWFESLINVIWKIITFPFWLFYKLPQLFANTDTQAFALDVVKTIISAASLIAAIIAAIGLLVNYQDALKNRELTQERLVTDRFTKAVEQLGNDKEEVVIGGIYSLERIAKDSPKDQWTIMEVLTAFVRKNSPIPPEIQNLKEKTEQSKALENLAPVNIQIQAALTVIGRRDPEQDDTSDKAPKVGTWVSVKSLDLTYSNLSDFDLRDSNLSYGNLSYASLSDSDLGGANLSEADLSYANLGGANLRDSNLSYGNLSYANLSDSDLGGANLGEANLSYANLSNKKIKSACFWEKAIYTDVIYIDALRKWIVVDQLANQKKIQEIKQDKSSDLEILPNCNQ